MKILMVDHKADRIVANLIGIYEELGEDAPEFVTCSTMHDVTPDLLADVSLALIDRYIIEADELSMLEMLRMHNVERIVGMGRSTEDRLAFEAIGLQYADKNAGFEQLVFRIRNLKVQPSS